MKTRAAVFLSLLLAAGAATAEPTPEPAPSVSPAAAPAPDRSVRISFLPPPMEGTISLGIYDGEGRLVRVLHREDEISRFQIGDDALVTFWDGRNDEGSEMPPGKYHARGIMVSHRIAPEFIAYFFQQASPDSSPLPAEDDPASGHEIFSVEAGVPVRSPAAGASPPPDRMFVKLVPNPLENDARRTLALEVAFDDEESWLQTADGLPLRTISADEKIRRIVLWKTARSTLDVFQDETEAVAQVRLAGLNRMMPFDAGAFTLK